MKNMGSKLANASQFMQNMSVDKLIEIVKAKIFLEFHSIKIMIHLGWVAKSMVIFSASYGISRFYNLGHKK